VKPIRHLLLIPVVLAASCASDSTAAKKKAEPTGATQRSADQWLADTTKDNGYTTDANGNFVPKSKKRSQFENMGESAYFKKDYKKQEYKTGDYTKKSWWGNKEYDRKNYAGNTDGSRFQKASAAQGKGAREGGNAVDLPNAYQTDSYATDSARESQKSSIEKPSNDGIENRRGVFKHPEIIDWREQRSLSLDQSKGILGR
jgi:hypothetical protein